MTYKLLVFSLAIVMLLSIGLMADLIDGRGNQSVSLTSPTISPPGVPPLEKGAQAVVWDNGMGYVGLLTAQQETDPTGLDSEPADDFIFDVDQVVNDVHWIGGYWNGPPDDGDFDWTIRFYQDDGTGTKPGVLLATYPFANADVNETLIASGYYSYSVNLPPSGITFLAGQKYWISIQSQGDTPPQGGWAYHEDPITLHEAVIRSVYFGLPNWTNLSAALGVAGDMCFQLTYEERCSWQPGDPHKMHYPQLPDEAGWDVNATYNPGGLPMVLADDFKCMKTGQILDVHFWGSWKNGIEGQIVSFFLSIHEDIPADPPAVPYSRPGQTLWEREVSDFGATPRDPPTAEGWYDPATGEIIYADHQAYFQYDICFDPSDPDLFVQDSGTIYWLNISAILLDPVGTTWGWKSTMNHWNDDAVWAFWGDLNWVDIWQPPTPKINGWGVVIDESGEFVSGYGNGAYNEPEPWFYYDWYDWWNVWFYDHPFDTTRTKYGQLIFTPVPFNESAPYYLEVAVNWSTDLWYYDSAGADYPPLPGVNEDMYIGRHVLLETDIFDGTEYVLTYDIPWYNPEWVSVDVSGFNFEISEGTIEHDCQGSLDLAFVITGEEEPPPDSGACCYDPTGGPPGTCIYTTQYDCEQILGGVYQGNNVPCQGQEACCLPGGSCVMADALCCVNELGGTPQGPGSTCQPLEACCFTDGSCQNLDPQCCIVEGGTPQGPGTSCSPAEACCFTDGSCRMLAPECCDDIGGTPQGPGTTCAGTVACCLPDGTCQTVSAICCDELGGTPSPFGAPQCLGDLNGDGTDDACQIREDLKWRQAPDLEPTGMDVDASCPGLSHECVLLAADYRCIQTGPITEIHIYGSWFEEMYPGGDPGMVTFTLSIHGDVPAGADLPWSHPGEMLWMHTFWPGTYLFRPYAEDIVEGFYDPVQEYYQPVADFVCWEYIFFIPEDSQFIQQGTETEPVIYWLDVEARPEPAGSAVFGWKTSRDQWNDDAAWAFGPDPVPPLSWIEMRYPLGHPFETQSIDLAFEIYGEAGGPCDCLPGDANGSGDYSVGDATYMINYIFKGGPPPTPYRLCSGDANCDCTLSIGDAVYMINYIFKGGPPPCDCLTWLALCGPPLRK